MKTIYISYLLVAFNLISLKVYSQVGKVFSYIRYSIEDGLNANEIYGVTQDQEGYLWITTDNGLFKFGGNTFKHYGKDKGLISRVFTRVYCISNGTIIAIGEKPNKIYSIHNEKVKDLSGLNKFIIKGSLTREFQGKIFAKEHGGSFYEITKDSILKYPYPNFECDQKRGLESFIPLTLREFLVTNSHQVAFRFNFVDKDTCYTPPYHIPEIYAFGLDYYQNTLAFHSGGISEIDSLHNHKFIGKPDSRVFGIHAIHLVGDKTGNYWIAGAHNGLFQYKPELNITIDAASQLGLEEIQVTHVFEDRDGNIWVSTSSKGLYCILHSDFKKIQLSEDEDANYIVYLTESPNGNIWVGSNLNIHQIQLDTAQVKISKISEFKKTGYISYILPWKGDSIIYTGNTPYQNPDSIKEKLVQSDGLTAYYHNPDGSSYYGYWGMINYSENDSWILKNRKYGERISKDLTFQKVIDFQKFKGDLIGISSNYFFKLDNKTLESLPLPKVFKNQQRPNYVLYNLHQDQQGDLWLGSSLGIFKKDDDRWIHFNSSDGLSSNACLSVVSDHLNNIWIGTDRGLNVFRNGEFTTYTKSNGLASNKVNALYFDPSHKTLWVGTNSGLCYVKPEDLIYNPKSTPSLEIQPLQIIGDSIYEIEKNSSLSPTENNIRIKFEVSNLSSPTEFLFRYKLLNTGVDWQTTKKEEIDYLSLGPGNYTFTVMAKRPGGNWGEPVEIDFEIRNYFWERWSFWLTLSGSILVITVILSSNRIRQIRKKESQKLQIERRINKLRQEALLASMNPHFIFNSLNSVQHFLSKHKDPIAIDFVAEFGRLIRQNMDFSRREFNTVEEELDYLKRYLKLESLRFENELQFSVIAQDQLIQEKIPIPSMIIQPFVENALWHGLSPSVNAGEIKVEIKKKDDSQMLISIEDNGRGISKKPKKSVQGDHESMGIQLIEERIKILSSSNSIDLINLRSLDPMRSGTRVLITLNIKELISKHKSIESNGINKLA